MENLRDSMGKQPDLQGEAVKSVRAALVQFTRNGRWGTCLECPTNNEGRFPEFCPQTERYDHQLKIEGIAEKFNRRLDELKTRQINEQLPH